MNFFKGIFAATLVASVMFTHANETNSENAAELLLDSMNMEVIVDQSIQVAIDAQVKLTPQLQPYKDVVIEFVKKYSSYQALKPRLIEIYSQNFTPKELTDLTTFYKTPTGQKSLHKLPELISQGMQLGQQVAQEHKAELISLIDQKRKCMSAKENNDASNLSCK